MTTTREHRIPFGVYNFAPKDPDDSLAQLSKEMLAIRNVKPVDRDRQQTKATLGVETVGWGKLPAFGANMIRDTSTPERANLTLWLAKRLTIVSVEWVKSPGVWPRTQHGGMHDPRVFIKAVVKTKTLPPTRVIGGHAPPGVPGADEARKTWVRTAADLCDTKMPVLLLADPNGLIDDLLRYIGDPKAVTCGTAGEAAYARGFIFDSADTYNEVNGVTMRTTDHGAGCLLGRAILR